MITQIVDKVKEMLEPIAEEKGYYIVDITYRREGGKPVLRILADKLGGITLADCTEFNNRLSELLDKENIIEEGYLLEVSSPGLDRKLEKESDFRWAIGKYVKVSTYTAVEGKKVFVGTLLGLGDGTIVLDEDGIATEIPMDKIANAKLEP